MNKSKKVKNSWEMPYCYIQSKFFTPYSYSVLNQAFFHEITFKFHRVEK